MFVHIIILISVLVLSSFFVKNQEAQYDNGLTKMKPNISKIGAVIVFSVMLFFAAYRTHFIDTLAYTAEFYGLKTGFSEAVDIFKSDLNDSGGNTAIAIIIKTIFGNNTELYLFIVSLYCAVGVSTLFRKYSVDYRYSVFLFVCTMEYTWLFNGLRQSLAIFTIVLCCEALIEKKHIKFLIAVFIAYTFHPSAIIWIPMYFFVHEKPWSKKMLLFILGLLAILLFLNNFTDFLGDVLEGTVYEGYTDTFEDDNGINIIRVAFFSIPTILAFLNREQIAKEAPRPIQICVNLSVVALGIFIIGIFTSGILFGRLPSYFNQFSWVLMAWMYKNVFVKEKSFIKTILNFIFVAFFMYNMFYTSYGQYTSATLGIG